MKYLPSSVVAILMLAGSELSAQSTASAFFDGAGDRIRILDSNPLHPSANPSAYVLTGPMTVEAWVFPMAYPAPGAGMYIAARPNEALADPWHTYALKVDNYGGSGPRFSFSVSDGVTPGPLSVYVADVDTVELGRWYHVAGTYDGTTISLYVDGVLVNSVTASVTVDPGFYGFYIGGTITDYWRGLIDEVRLWSISRSASDILSTRDAELTGTESGLAGYWQLESFGTTYGALSTADSTANNNELLVQGNTTLQSAGFGSTVSFPPTYGTAYNYAVAGQSYQYAVATDGFPFPDVTVVSGPTGMTYTGGQLTWNPDPGTFGNFEVVLNLTNAGGSVQDTTFVYVEATTRQQNQVTLDVANRGKIGAFGQYDQGMYFNGLNGLYAADFSLVDKNDGKFAGGLFSTTVSFSPTSAYVDATSPIDGFSARRATFTDEWEPNRINVSVENLVHSSSLAPDNTFIITEYRVVNNNASSIDSLFAQMTADFDVGVPGSNRAGYDDALQLTYAFEDGGASNANFYGMQILGSTVAGRAMWTGSNAPYVRSVQNLTSQVGPPLNPSDIRAQLTVGPYNLTPSETLVVYVTWHAASNLQGLRVSAERAKYLLQSLNAGDGLLAVSEQEPNDATIESNLGQIDMFYTGSISSDTDVDYFHIFASVGDTIRVEGVAVPGSDLLYRYEIYNSSGGTQYQSNWYRTAEKLPYGSFYVYETGTYYIRVVGAYNYSTSFPSKTAPGPTKEQLELERVSTVLSEKFRTAASDTGSYALKVERFTPGPPVFGYDYRRLGTFQQQILSMVGWSNGATTDLYVEFGETPSLGSIQPADYEFTPYYWANSTNATLTGLRPSTTYYYRVRMTNAFGTVAGPIASFMTPAYSPDWAHHRVRNSDGSPIGSYESRQSVSPDGALYVASDAVYRSTDGGHRWAQTYPYYTYYHYARDAHFFDASTGISVGSGTEPIVWTNDSGQTWSNVFNTFGVYYNLGVIGTFDGSVLIAAGDNGEVLRSTDGGLSWLSANVGGSTARINDVLFASGSDVYYGDSWGDVYLSTTGGTSGSWTFVSSTSNGNSIQSLEYVSGTVLLAGVYPGIIRSTDGGATWSSVLNGGLTIFDIRMWDNQNGLAVGDEGRMFLTSDGGVSWEEKPSGTNVTLWDITRGPQFVSVTGVDGVLLFRGVSTESEDNGSANTANPSSFADTILAEIEPPAGDVDYFSFDASAGDTVEIISQNRAGSSLDGYLQIFDAMGNVVAQNDDFVYTGGEENNSLVVFAASVSSTYYVRMTSVGTGGSFPFKTLGSDKEPEILPQLETPKKVLSAQTAYRLTIRKSGGQAPRVSAYFTTGRFHDRFKQVANVVPYGSPTTVTIEYGPSPGDLSQSVNATEGSLSALGLTTANILVTGLSAGSTVYYRVVASNAYGSDATPEFAITLPAAPDVWTLSFIGTETRLNDVSMSTNHADALVVGNNGFGARTKDGGVTWTPMNLGVGSGSTLYAVQLLSDDATAVAVGSADAFRRTTNGGLTWNPVSKPFALDWRDVWFIDAFRGVVAGSNGTILRTVDGGASWSNVVTGIIGGTFWGVYMFDPNNIIAVGDGGMVARTSNGGLSWNTFPLGGAGGSLTGVAFENAFNGVAVSSDGRVYGTNDGGFSWFQGVSGTASVLRRVASAGGGVYWAASYDGLMYQTVDGGMTWAPVNIGSGSLVVSVRSVSADHLVGVGDFGSFFQRDVRPATVEFVVDMAPAILRGKFKPGQDLLGVRGSASPLDWGATTGPFSPLGDSLYSMTINFPSIGDLRYKFVIEHRGELYWEGQTPGLPDFGNRSQNLLHGYQLVGPLSFDDIPEYSTAPSEYALDSTTIALWRMDDDPLTNPTATGSSEILFDRSDSGYHAENYGPVSADGRHGLARLFDGIDDSVVIRYDVLQRPADSSFTVEAWVYLTGYPSANGDLFQSVGQTEMFLGIKPSGRLLAGVRGNDLVLRVDSSSVSVPLNVWSHVAFVYSGPTKTFVTFVNGVPSTPRNLLASFEFGSFFSQPRAYIGRGVVPPFDPGFHLPATIDEVRISSRAVPRSEFNLKLAPENVAALSTDGQVTLTWDESEGLSQLDRYVIFRGTGPATLSPFDSLYAGGGTQFVDQNVVNGVVYYYRIRAVDVTGFESVFSSLVAGTPLPRPLPTSVSPVRHSWSAETTATVSATFNTALGSADSTPVFIAGNLSGRKQLDSTTYSTATRILTSYPRDLFVGEKIEVVSTRGAFNSNGDSAESGHLYQFNVRSYAGTGEMTLTSSVPSAGGGSPTYVAASDFDFDGDVDVVAVHPANNALVVYRNDGFGSFAADAEISSPNSPHSVAVIESPVIGRGVVVADWLGSSVSIYSNNGSGSLAPLGSYPVGSNPYAVAVADMNADGRMDIVVSSTGANEVRILYGRSDGTFSNSTTLSTLSPAPIVLVDFNRDGLLDIIVSNGPQNTLHLFRQFSGGFTSFGILNLSAYALSVEAGDIDGDGAIEIISGLDASTDNIVIHQLDNAGSEVSNSSLTVGNSIRGLRLADMNADLMPDIVLTDYTGDKVHILLQQAGGSFTSISNPTVDVGPWEIVAADFDADGDVDVVTGHESGSSLAVLRNNYDSTPPAAPSGLTSSAQSGEVSLTWTAGVESDLARYRIYRDSFSPPTTQLDSVPTGVTLYTDNAVSDSVIYYYAVSSVDQSRNESGKSEVRVALPHAPAAGEYVTDGSTLFLVHFAESNPANVVDESGNERIGTAVGTQVVPGRFGSARAFDGTDDVIDFVGEVIPVTGTFTVEAWVYGTNAGVNKEILSQGGSGNPFYLGYSSTGEIRVSDQWTSTGVAFPFDGWHHIAVVRSSSETELYLDGELRASLGSPLPDIGSGGSFAIGKQHTGGEFWPGMIDEIRVSTGTTSPSSFNLQRTPRSVTATRSGTTINLSWQNGGGSVAPRWYKVYRSLANGDSTTLSLYDSTSSTSYSDADLEPATSYYYRITAEDITGFESPRSYAATQTTSSAPQQATVTTFAGSSSGFLDGTGASAQLNTPTGVAVGPDGFIYVADMGNNAIRKVSHTKGVTTIAGDPGGAAGFVNANGSAASFNAPSDLAVDGLGNIYVADRLNHVIRKISPNGDVTTYAGTGSPGLDDGDTTVATFNQPGGITIDASGNLYVTEKGNHAIRKVSTSRLVTTLAGSFSGASGFVDGSAFSSRFNTPGGVVIEPSGNLLVADEGNHAVRRVVMTPSVSVSTIAGAPPDSGAMAGYVDSSLSAAARFNGPVDVDLDLTGNIFVTDRDNHVVRRISSSGAVSTLAGSGSAGSVDDIGTAASFSLPIGLATDLVGNMFVVDGNHRVRRIIANYLPSSYTAEATGISTTGATLRGFVNPNTLTADAYFEYGTSTSYGVTTALQSAIGTAPNYVSVSQAITGLTANTVYHFRVAGVNESGTTFGPDMTLTTQLPAPAATTLISPDSAGTNISAAPTLRWRKGTNATSYDVQVSTTALFTSTVIDSSGLPDTVAQVGPLAHETQFFWRVRSANESGSSAFSPIWSFTTVVDTPDVPLLVSPVANAVNTSTSPALSWNASARVTTYHLQVSASPDFSLLSFEDSTLTDTTRSLAGLANSTTYYWRLRAKNAGGTSAYSEIRQFTTIIAIPSVPALSSPADSATQVSLTTALTWTTAARAASYRVQVSTSSSFGTLVVDSAGITQTTFSPSGLQNNTSYFWRVSASNAGGSSAFSASRRFTTIVAPPDVPVLASPANLATDQLTTLSLNWNPAARASEYNLQVSSSSSFSSFVVNDTTITDTTAEVSSLANSSTYHWRVRARNVAGYSSFSSSRSFTTVASAPDVPTLASPEDGAVDQPVTLTMTWNAASGASSYRLEVSADSTFASFFFVDSSITATSRGVAGLPYATIIYWRVRAQNPGGSSAYSDSRRFTTVIEPAVAPILAYPDSNATDVPTTVTLSWYAASRAQSYRLQVSRVASFSTTISDQQNVSDTSFSIGPLDNDSTYYWRVRGVSLSGDGPYSNVWNFKTVIAAPPAPTLILPNDNSTGQPILMTFSWNAALRASTYRLEVSTSSGFETLAFVDSTLSSTSIQVNLEYATAYFWRVRGQNAGGAGTYSPVRSFTTIVQSPDAPVLFSPDSGAANEPTTIDFVWRSAARASTYRLQVSLISNFSTTISDQPSLSDTSLLVGPLQYNTEYFWRVNATNAGGTSSYAPTWRFRTSVQPPESPTLVAPADLAIDVPRSAVITWNSALRATSYQLQISTDASFSGLLVDSAGISSTSFTTGLLDYSTLHYWRVRGSNSGGNSAWAAVRRFTTVDPLPLTALDPPSVDFGNVETGFETRDTVITVRNDGGSNLNVSGTSFTGANASEFSILSGGGAFVLGAAQARQITVRFTPATTGPKIALLSLSTNDVSRNPSGLVVDSIRANAVDTRAPFDAALVLSVTPSGWTSQQDVTVSWSPSLVDVSGLQNVLFTFDTPPSNTNPGTAMNYAGGDLIQLSAPSEGRHTLYFYFEDGAGNKDLDQRYQVPITWDATAPQVTHDSTLVPEVTVAGGSSSPPVTITADISDPGGSGLQGAVVEYRRAETSSYSSLPVPATLPSSIFVMNDQAPASVVYRIVATDSAGNRTTTKVYSILARTGASENVPPAPQPQVGVASLPSGSDEIDAYRIFSVPYDLDDKRPDAHFVASFGPHESDGKPYVNWRLQRYRNGVKEDFDAFRSENALTLGAGFFLIVREGGRTFSPQSGARVVTAQEMNDVGIGVQSGWNIVGNPFRFAVPVESLQVRAGVIQQVAYFSGSNTTSGWDLSGPNVSNIKPWEGLAIRASLATQLLFRTIGTQPGIADPDHPDNPLLAAQSVAEDPAEGEWSIRLSAVREDNGRRDIAKVAGMRTGADEGIDPFDRFQPPFIGRRNVALFFDSEDEELFEDFRPISPDGGAWEVKLVTGDQGSRVTINVDGTRSLPNQDFQAFLIDFDQKMAWDIVKDSEVSLNAGSGLRNLRVVVGTREFVNRNNGGVDLYPQQFMLYPNYPNPFNPETIIRYSIAESAVDAMVTIDVFDLLGRRISTIIDGSQGPGYYEATFDGSRLSTGAYVYRMQVRDAGGKSVYQRVQRMLLVK